MNLLNKEEKRKRRRRKGRRRRTIRVESTGVDVGPDKEKPASYIRYKRICPTFTRREKPRGFEAQLLLSFSSVSSLGRLEHELLTPDTLGVLAYLVRDLPSRSSVLCPMHSCALFLSTGLPLHSLLCFPPC